MRALVIDKNRKQLAPCPENRARRLLKAKKASILRRFPFTIILHYAVDDEISGMSLKIDPGGTTGLAMVAEHKKGKTVVWNANLKHRSKQIKRDLLNRNQIRKSRRSRKTRYREARFLNRKRAESWLPPSIEHRVLTTITWIKKLMRFAPITHIDAEINRFDPQKMQNPEISGIEYKQGTLQGYDVREYLLQKWERTCVYCNAQNVPLQIEHITPKSRGGSDRISNLCTACERCNLKKGTQTAIEFGFPNIQIQAKESLREAAYLNAVRYKLQNEIKKLNISCLFWTGSQTKMNRIFQNYPKDHWVDAACSGVSGANVRITNFNVLQIKCLGHGSRQMISVNKLGYPRTKPKERRRDYWGFHSGDYVKALVTKGKKKGIYNGTVICKKNGQFSIKGKAESLNKIYFTLLQKKDGYILSLSFNNQE